MWVGAVVSELVIDFKNGLVWFDCPRCAGSGIDPIRLGIGDEHPCDPDYCHECGGMMQTVVDVRTFAANLATAGGLQLSWGLCHEYNNGPTYGPEPWRPGCNRPAPGWSKGEGR